MQGPALCVYNDAVFETQDWEGIRMLHESVKEKDPLKVGRFGLGFKSVFHLAGQFLSRGGLLLLPDVVLFLYYYCARGFLVFKVIKTFKRLA